ncbi:MAG: GNAT family N-acetyltransferase [Anaerolineae bacterium]|nr:GNAT family N-acetyltransferase [Anaerolineae bacterium]
MEYKIITLRPPVKDWIRPLLSLYSYWDQSHRFNAWTEDLRYRLDGKGGRDLFHVTMDKSNPIACLDVSTSRSDVRVGCVHRLFEHPEYRRQGLSRELLKHAFEHFRADGGEFLMLNSGWDTSIYHLYQEFGFHEIRRDPWSDGVVMGRTVSGQPVHEWVEDYFVSNESIKTTQLTPGHWASLMLLCNQPLPYLVRHYGLGIFDDWAVDGRLLGLFEVLETGKGMAIGLQTPGGALVGFATLMPFLDPWPVASYQQHIRLLDVWVHPNFAQHTARLLHEIITWTHPLSEDIQYIMAYVDSNRQDLCAAFEQESWQLMARLSDRYRDVQGRMVDMLIFRQDKPKATV